MEQTVAKWMTREVATVGPDEPLFAAVEILAERAIRHVAVRDADARDVVGILSNRDLIRAVLQHPDRRLDLHGTRVADVMTAAPLESTAPEAPLSEAAEQMHRTRVNALLVLSGGELAGILTSDDILAAVALGGCRPARPDT